MLYSIMTAHILRRLVQAVPTFFGITIISFVLIISAPGDPVSLITFNPKSTPESAIILRHQLGLDQPIFIQYIYWLIGNDWAGGDGVRRGLLRGDLGTSLFQKRPVLDLILERIPATLQLTGSALLVGYLIGLPLGVLAAVRQRSWIDQVSRMISVIGNAVPSYWLGLILIVVFSVTLGWLPMSGMSNIARPDASFNLLETLSYMVMPVTVLSLGTIATVSRYVRSELHEVTREDYVRTARAKGLRGRSIWMVHALRNALIPVATLIGPALGSLLGGAVIVEQVFGWPGLGRLEVNAVFQRDYPLVMGSVVVGAVLFVLGVLMSDVLYVLLDPRIRLE